MKELYCLDIHEVVAKFVHQLAVSFTLSKNFSVEVFRHFCDAFWGFCRKVTQDKADSSALKLFHSLDMTLLGRGSTVTASSNRSQTMNLKKASFKVVSILTVSCKRTTVSSWSCLWYCLCFCLSWRFWRWWWTYLQASRISTV